MRRIDLNHKTEKKRFNSQEWKLRSTSNKIAFLSLKGRMELFHYERERTVVFVNLQANCTSSIQKQKSSESFGQFMTETLNSSYST